MRHLKLSALALVLGGASLASTASVFAQPEAVGDVNLESTARPEAMGSIGVGYFTVAAPIGIRSWSETGDLGYDLGVGFGYDTDSSDVMIAAEGGLLYALKTWENAIMFARGGVGFTFSTGAEGFGFIIDGMIGGEFFLTELGFPMLSFTGGIGLELGISKPDGADVTFAIGTGSDAVSVVATAGLGFHIYFM